MFEDPGSNHFHRVGVFPACSERVIELPAQTFVEELLNCETGFPETSNGDRQIPQPNVPATKYFGVEF